MKAMFARCFTLVCLLDISCAAQRIAVPLDGEWRIEESASPDQIPGIFGHVTQVPGLVASATPPFPDVNDYETREWIDHMIGFKLLPPTEAIAGLGRTKQTRNYFWYQRVFRSPARRQRALLVVNKAQFGTAVWLNGKRIGEHLGCFTAGQFDLTDAIDWSRENRLTVRIGAHPGALPEWVPFGTDKEKRQWTPGIYDSVSVLLSDNPVITSIQVAPRIQTSDILVETRVKNYGPARVVELTHAVKTWKGGTAVGRLERQRLQLAAGEEKTIRQTVPVPGAVLWSPENPFLYVVETSTGGDSTTTRFGMREFRFDTSTRRAYLNGKIYFMRGASITLHRFFADPKCGGLPWDEGWVRKLLAEIPKRMHWNSFRICIGPAPQKWLDVADEVGLLLQYEYPIWTGEKGGRNTWRERLWKADELTGEFREFLRDNWNHPSVVIWDASNETDMKVLREKVIPAVRGLDLSARPWENGYSVPVGPDDPWEEHIYLFSDSRKPSFEIKDIQGLSGAKPYHAPPLHPPSAHAAILNEYEFLWLKRDGTPTLLTQPVFDRLLGRDSSVEERRWLSGYLMGGLTELYRAYRQFAGVMFLAYLDADLPVAITSDFFRDVQRLELEPAFEDYMKEASKPLGVYLKFWQPAIQAGSQQTFRVLLANDSYEAARGTLELAYESEDTRTKVERTSCPFAVSGLGQMSYDIELAAPSAPGKYVLRAVAHWPGKPWSPTVSRRNLTVVTPVKK